MAAGRAKSGEVAPKPTVTKDTPELKFLKTDSDSPAEAVSGSLYRDEVARLKEKGDDSEYEEQQTNDI